MRSVGIFSNSIKHLLHFFHNRNAENTAYDMTYNSINYMFNSMRWANNDRLIRRDANFEEIVRKVGQH